MPGPLLTRIDPRMLEMMQQMQGQRPGGLRGFLSQPGLGAGLLQTGLGVLAQSDQPGSFLGALGRAAPQGIQQFQRSQADAEFEGAIQDMPAEMQAVLRSLQPGQRGPALMQLLQQPQRETTVVGQNSTLVDDATGEILFQGAQGEPASTNDIRNFLFAQSQGDTRSFEEFLAAGDGPLVDITNTVGDRAASAASTALGSSAAGRVVESADLASSSLTRIEGIEQLEGMLANPAFERVAGPGSTVKTFFERFSDDPTARALAAQYDAVAGEGVLVGLQAFPGQISNEERQFVVRISAADRSLTVDELRAGLAAIKRIQEHNAQAFVDEFDAFDPAAFNVDPAQMQQFRSLRDRISGGPLTLEQLEANFQRRPGG